jgi:hypothetical protein
MPQYGKKLLMQFSLQLNFQPRAVSPWTPTVSGETQLSVLGKLNDRLFGSREQLY